MDLCIRNMSDTFQKYSVGKQKSPSYVRIFSKIDKDIVLACAKNKPTNTYSSKMKQEDDQELFELTGSPLKLDLSLHTILDETLPTDDPQMWSKDEGQHAPIVLKNARDIANVYNQALRQHCTQDDMHPMWVLCSPTDEQKTLLITAQSYKDYLTRGIVTYEGSMNFDDIDIEELVDQYAKGEKITIDMVSCDIECKYVLSGISYGVAHTTEELVNAPHGSCSELFCEWSGTNIHTPIMTCKVNFKQEVTVGHLASPCNSIWQSLCALYNINQLLVDMTVAGFNSVNLETSMIRRSIVGTKRPNSKKRLQNLLDEVETYAFMAQCPAGGCLCVNEDTTSLKMSLEALDSQGSSNDFTYKLWDIFKECETAEELISILLQALKFISSGKIRPFIDANNKTYLSKLVLKLSRGHSQTSKVLMNLRSNPPQALSLIAQVGIEKTMWEYTHIMSLIEHSFYIAGIWSTDNRSHESIEQINQTIQDMTMSGGDFSLNPFESLSQTAEHSIRLDCESFYEEDPHELTVDDFASLKKHGLVNEKRVANEVPLIADEIDISPWKNMLMKFAQVHVCLEHLYRAEMCLRADFASLKPLATKLLEIYVSDKSPVRTVGQLMNEPLQVIDVPITNNIVKDYLKKPVYWYRVTIDKKEKVGLKRDARLVYLFTQQPIFPPNVWQHVEPQADDVAEVTTVGEDLKYYCTKYTYLSNRMPVALTVTPKSP